MGGRYQSQPRKVPRVGHPIDLDEHLLDDLSRLFLVESFEADAEAGRLYIRGDYKAGAAAELRGQGLEFDSREIAHHAFTRFRHRDTHDTRNLAPWERKNKPPSPF